MRTYIARRMLAVVLVLFLVSVGIFMLIRLVPGDAVLAQIGEQGYISQQDLEKVRHQLGLDRPWHIQYMSWISNLVRGNLGVALWSGKPVAEELARTLPVSLELTIIALAVSTVVAIPAGVISARFKGTVVDQSIRFFAILGLGIPEFLIAVLLIWALSQYLSWIPPIGYVPLFEKPWNNLQQFFIPGILMGLYMGAGTIRMTRTTVLEVLGEDYVRTARAKGLRESWVLLRHVLKNALIPVVTIFGNRIPSLLGGVVIIETIFALPGVGRLTLSAIEHRDYLQIQGNIMVLSLWVVAANLITDLSYAWLDPRIRYK